MSYIHKALKKAQKEKETRYHKYPGMVSTPGYRSRLFAGKALWLVPFFLISLALAAYFLLLSTGTQSSVPEHVRPTATPQTPRESKQVSPSKPKATPRPQPTSRQVTRQAQVTPQSQVTSQPQVPPRPQVAPRPQPTSRHVTPQAQVTQRSQVKPPSPETLPGPVAPSPQATPQSAVTPRTQSAAGVAALYEQARGLHKGGHLREAMRLYQKTLSLDPNNVDALNNLGVIHIQNRSYPAARASFEKALRLRPDYVDSHYNLACLHALQGRVSQSLIHLKRAVSLDQSVKDWARVDADLRNLRGVPEFEEMIGYRGE